MSVADACRHEDPVGDVRRRARTIFSPVEPPAVARPASADGLRARAVGVPSSVSAAVRTRRRRRRRAARAAAPSVPNSAIGSAPSTSVVQHGTGATVRPCSSSSRHSSRKPKPPPPTPRAARCRAGRPWRARPTCRGRTSRRSSSSSLQVLERHAVARICVARSLDLLLLFGEGEVHGASRLPTAGASRACRGRTSR